MKIFIRLLLVSALCIGSLELQAVAGIGEHHAPFGDKQHCRELATDIKATARKPNKTKQDIDKLQKLQFNFSKEDCATKLKPK